MNKREITYPTFEPDGWRIIPSIRLPLNYRELIPLFYENNGKEIIEEYVEALEGLCRLQRTMGVLEIGLRWDDEKGLTNINLGTHSGLDLDTSLTPRFSEHNIGFGNSFIGGAVAMKYVSELTKLKDIAE